MSIEGDPVPVATWLKAILVPSGENCGKASSSGPPTRSRVAPVTGSPTYRSPLDTYGMSPLAAGPNGAGRGVLGREAIYAPMARAATSNMSRMAIAKVRIGGDTLAPGSVVSAMGRILSRMVRAGRWRWPAVRARMSSR